MGNRDQLDAMGKKILGTVRNELQVSMRFMAPALSSLGFVMDLSTKTAGTDASFIRFNPSYLFQVFLDRPYRLDRLYMHMLVHCLFRHMFSMNEFPDRELFHLAADIAAESVIDSMDYPVIRVTPSDYREEWYRKLREETGLLTLPKVYRYFAQRPRDYREEARLSREFLCDDHSFWDRLDHKDPEKPENDSRNRLLREKNRIEWEKNAKKIQTELEARGKERSEEQGDLEWILSFENKKRTDYREFLQQFTVVREEARIDLDSFDYGFYNYGMELYGNLPLIEENEYREAKKIEELVIAIDTSASCKETQVQKFLNGTAGILETGESFFHHVSVYIVECDEKIQNYVHLDRISDLRQYAAAFHVHGGGGTDFRPVFRWTQEMQKKGALKDLRGLLYFTDGYGVWPEEPTRYETAFIFSGEEETNDDAAPDWAMKLYI